MLGSGVACGITALVFLATLQSTRAGLRASVGNPFLPTATSREAGQLSIPSAAHPVSQGLTGRGNGPLAAGLRPPRADLVAHVPLQADHDLFQILRDGRLEIESQDGAVRQIESGEIQYVA